MVNLWVTVLALMFAITASEARRVSPAEFLESGANGIIDIGSVLSVFEKGNLDTTTIRLKQSHSFAPPRPLFMVSPRKTGVYPVLFFVHGTMLSNDFYSDLFEHVASHGFVVVAPQLYLIPIVSQPTEIERAVAVANWLGTTLDSVLPEGVKGDLSRLAMSGHSRGAKTAFALALGKHTTPLQVKISALIGVDPVAGRSKKDRTEPHILTYVPISFNLSIPITIIGTGLGNHSKFPFGIGPSCAPNEVSHKEFFNECKEYCTHFVTTDYGHMDMLNVNVVLNPLGSIARSMCVNGRGNGGPMRRTLGGIMIAFLDAYFLDEAATFDTILANPSVAPAKIYPVQTKPKVDRLAQSYAQL